MGRHVRVRARQQGVQGWRRPANADGAIVYAAYGEESAEAGAGGVAVGWHPVGMFFKNALRFVVPPNIPPGTKIRLTARWFNRLGTGPACTAVVATVGHEGSMPVNPNALAK